MKPLVIWPADILVKVLTQSGRLFGCTVNVTTRKRLLSSLGDVVPAVIVLVVTVGDIAVLYVARSLQRLNVLFVELAHFLVWYVRQVVFIVWHVGLMELLQGVHVGLTLVVVRVDHGAVFARVRVDVRLEK